MKSSIRVFLCIQSLSIIGASASPLYGPGVEPAEKDELPFVVALSVAPASGPQHHFCGGALITTKHILTSRRCLELQSPAETTRLISQTRVTVGSDDLAQGHKYTIEKFTPFEQWATKSYVDVDRQLSHDLVVAKLSKEVKPEYGKPAKLSKLTDDELAGHVATMAGWGSTSYCFHHGKGPRLLHKAQVRVLSREEAVKNYRETKRDERKYIGNHLCTKGTRPVGLGKGDPGGPIFIVGDDGPEIIGVINHACLNHDINHPNMHVAHQSTNYYGQFIEDVSRKKIDRLRLALRKKFLKFFS